MSSNLTAFCYDRDGNTAIYCYPQSQGMNVYVILLSKCGNFELERRKLSYLKGLTEGKIRRKLKKYLETNPVNNPFINASCFERPLSA